MKIRGIHAPAYGGQEGGRKIRMERDGFTIIRISGNRMKRDVIESPVGSLKGNGHPAIFPEQVIREIIRLLSPPGGIVLDHYVGSGTTLVSALKEGRNCIGIDISEEYCKASAARVRDDDGIDAGNHMDEGTVLDRALQEADTLNDLPDCGGIEPQVDTILERQQTSRGVLAVVITLMTKKVADPDQDIRMHQAGMPGGFSGRVLDTQVVTAFSSLS